MIVQLLFLALVVTTNPLEKVWDTDYYSIYFENYGEDAVDIVVVERDGNPFDHRLYLLSGKLYRYPDYGFLDGIFYIGEASGYHFLKFNQRGRVFEGTGDLMCIRIPGQESCFDRIFEFHQNQGVHKVEIYDKNGTLVGVLYNETIVLEKPPDEPLFVGIVIDDKWSVGLGFVIDEGWSVGNEDVEIGIKNGIAGAWVYNLGYIRAEGTCYSFRPGDHPEVGTEVYYYYNGLTPLPNVSVENLNYQIVVLLTVLVVILVLVAVVIYKRLS